MFALLCKRKRNIRINNNAAGLPANQYQKQSLFRIGSHQRRWRKLRNPNKSQLIAHCLWVINFASKQICAAITVSETPENKKASN